MFLPLNADTIEQTIDINQLSEETKFVLFTCDMVICGYSELALSKSLKKCNNHCTAVRFRLKYTISFKN